MKRTNRYVLASEIVKPYFLDHISSQSALSSLCKNQLDFDEGQFFIDLPEFCHFNRLYKFDSGGMLPERDMGADPKKNAFGEEYTPRSYDSTENEICHFILQFLKSHENHFAMFHDINVTPNDKYIDIKNVKTVLDGQEVYHVLNRANGIDEVKDTFNCCCFPHYTIIVLGNGILKNSLNFIRDNQNLISMSVKYVIGSAYDGEAYIVWQNDLIIRMKS